MTGADPLSPLKQALHKWGVLANEIPEFKLKEISLSQTAELLKQLGNSKTAGNDELDAMSIKVVAVSLLQPIQYIINQSI